jgi:hypothetical protein
MRNIDRVRWSDRVMMTCLRRPYRWSDRGVRKLLENRVCHVIQLDLV